MPDLLRTTVAYGDTVLFIGKDRKTFMRTLVPGERLQTHYGYVAYDDVIGESFGSRLQTHLGHDIWMLTPNIDDVILHLRRETQIIFPKDLGYIALKLGIQPGVQVIEAGTGSGGLTLTLASLVGQEGHVYSYDRRSRMQQIAKRNLARFDLVERVTFYERDIAEGFDEQDVHALFLDLPEPWTYLPQAYAALRGGGFLGCLVPTINQVVEFNQALHSRHWFYIQVEELLLRQYKTVPQRVRPNDQMVGHTGYLIFARKLMLGENAAEEASPDPDEDSADTA